MGNRLVLIIFLVMVLLLPSMVYAQDPGDPPPPDDYTPPPGLEWTQDSSLLDHAPQDSEDLGWFYPPVDPIAEQAINNAVLAKNISFLPIPFHVRTCPTTHDMCADEIPNDTVGWWGQGDAHYISFNDEDCVFSGKWKWCYSPDFDPDPDDGNLIGWIAVRRIGKHDSWIVRVGQ